ncbi:MAG TPA: phosphotransferase [Mycobacteriales bacterium]|jgi:aminoglycoside phosphotransferase (APT) family kinase protein
MLDEALDAVLDRLPSLAQRPRTITPLTGGLSNHSYRVETPAVTAVLRIPSGAPGLLGVDRANEYRNTTAAHAAGIGPPVLDHLPDLGVTVVGWLDGAPPDLRDPAALDRVVAACRTLHGGPRFAVDIDLPALQRRYRGLCASHGLAVPPGYDDHQRAFDRVAALVAAGAERTVPCHNDLGAANMLDDGVRVAFVDYEYSGNNDPDFELGNLAGQAGLPPEEVVARYYGRWRPSRTARATLYGVLTAHTWVLWGVIQAGTGGPELGTWITEQHARAVAGLTSPGLPDLLGAALGSD